MDYKLPKLISGLVVGLDFSGVVEEVDAEVKEFKVGDEVYGNSRGSLAEFVLVDPTKCALKPARLSWLEAAAMPTAYLTALQGLRHCHFAAGLQDLIRLPS